MSDSSSEMIEELPPRPPGIEKLMYLLATSMTVLPLIAIALRFYARQLKKTGLSWDDYMILPAMVCDFPTNELQSINEIIAWNHSNSHMHIHW